MDGSQYWFGESIDDATWLEIDGTVVLSDSTWNNFATGTITREAGWYDFEVRFWDGSGGSGVANSAEDRNGRLCGFGYLTGATKPTNMNQCLYPEDDGTMCIFRYDDGTGFVGINVFGDPGNLGTPTPDYGEYPEVTEGTTYKLTCPEFATNAAQTIAYRLKGWELKVNDVLAATNTAENVTNCTYVCTNAADKMGLTWKWEVTHYKLDVATSGNGTVDVASQWVEPGTALSLTATPGAGQKFFRWTGSGFASGETYQTNCTVTVSEPRTVTANFYDPAATPRVVRYVTPSGAGTKDGTSWANAMASVASAYNSAGANPSGGEVWVRYGTYNFSKVSMLPNITVRGGFAGDETLASEADPTNNPTIFSNGFDSNQKWKSGSETWPAWTARNGRYFFNDPPCAGDTSMYGQFSEMGDNYAFSRDDGGLIGETEFNGLIFNRYWTSAIRYSGENPSPIRFCKCRFLYIGWNTNNSRFILEMRGIDLDMEDCEFVGVNSPILMQTVSTASPQKALTLNRCRFYTTAGCWNSTTRHVAGFCALRNVAVTVRNCSFDRSVGGGSSAGAMLLEVNRSALVEDTVITRSTSGHSRYGGGIYWLPETNTAVLAINRCRLERCQYLGNASWTDTEARAAALTLDGDMNYTGHRVNITDTAFVSNSVVRKFDRGYGSSCIAYGASAYCLPGHHLVSCANCLFEGNTAANTTNLFTSMGTFCRNWTSATCLSFANCVFRNNDVGYTDAKGAFVRTKEFANCSGAYFVNCSFEHLADDYNPWSNSPGYSFVCCTSSGTNSFGGVSAKDMRYAPLDAETCAGYESAPLTNGAVVARRLEPTSRYRSKGRPVWRANNGDFYIYDAGYNAAKPWRLLRSSSTLLTDAQAADVGVSLAAQPIPDAFAAPRRKTKCALGNLNPRPTGAALRLR